MKTYTIRSGGPAESDGIDFSEGVILSTCCETGWEGIMLGERRTRKAPCSRTAWVFVDYESSIRPEKNLVSGEVFDVAISFRSKQGKETVTLMHPKVAHDLHSPTEILVKVEALRSERDGIESCLAYRGNPVLILSGSIQRRGVVSVVYDTLWILPVGSALIIKFLNQPLIEGTVVDVTETGPQVYSYADFQAKLQ